MRGGAIRWRGPAAGALLALAAGCLSRPLPPEPAPPAPERVQPSAPDAAARCARVERVEVHKAERRLVALCPGGVRVDLPVALGRDPRGAKRGAGDYRTPEGRYRVAEPPRPSRFHLFILLDYPSVADAERALQDGRIGRADFARVRDAHAAGDLPPQDTALGGYIGLHGEGERWRGRSLDLDWTDGCIALGDGDIEFLADRIQVGVPVVILP